MYTENFEFFIQYTRTPAIFVFDFLEAHSLIHKSSTSYTNYLTGPLILYLLKISNKT